MTANTPRVDACIEAISTRFPSLKSTAYFEEVHQHITPLARNMEREIAELRTSLEAAQQQLAQRGGPVGSLGSMIVPKWAGKFDSYQHWVNKAQSWLKSPDHRRAMCVDSMGRRCAIGADFMRARDESTFPVHFFWECEVVTPPAAVQPDNGRDAALQIAIDACCQVESSAYKHNNHERASGAKFCADAIRGAMAVQHEEKGGVK